MEGNLEKGIEELTESLRRMENTAGRLHKAEPCLVKMQSGHGEATLTLPLNTDIASCSMRSWSCTLQVTAHICFSSCRWKPAAAGDCGHSQLWFSLVTRFLDLQYWVTTTECLSLSQGLDPAHGSYVCMHAIISYLFILNIISHYVAQVSFGLIILLLRVPMF